MGKREREESGWGAPKGGSSFPTEGEPRGKWAGAGPRAPGPLAGPVL